MCDRGRLLWSGVGLVLGALAAGMYFSQSRPAQAGNDRFEDYIMATGAVAVNPRSPTDGVWLLDYRAGKLMGTVIDRNLAKIIGWAEVDLVTEFGLPPRQNVHFLMTTGQIAQGQAALYVAETTSGKFGVYTMQPRPDGKPGIMINRHDLVMFRQRATIEAVTGTTGSPSSPTAGGKRMSIKVQVIFYSMYGHVHQLAEAVAAGAKEVAGAEVSLYQVAELVPEEALVRTGAKKAREAFAHLPLAKSDQLADADAIIFGTPTRFGNMCAQMRNFLDQTGKQWVQGTLIGKVGSVFTSTGTQHGGQETTLTSFHTTLLHHGMIIVGVPYSCQGLVNMNEITGGTPYGASTMAGSDGSRQPTANELSVARFQGKHVAEITLALQRGRKG